MNRNIFFLVIILSIVLFSCEDYFIEKPNVTGLSIEDVFSTKNNAEGAIAEAYGSILSSGLPALVWWTDNTSHPLTYPYESTEAIMGGEDVCQLGWGYMNPMCASGFIAKEANASGEGYSDDYFPNNFIFIRKAWVIFENIVHVADMTDNEKMIVQGEMQALVAFRYVEMLKRYGGVPLVDTILTVTDNIERSTVKETVDYIVELCNEAAEKLDGHVWPDNWLGRVNKGVALAIKAEALTYAARPLFNSAEPYLSMDDPEMNGLLCLQSYDKSRWEAAIDANKAVIEWGEDNGFYLLDTDNPFEDYGTAVGVPSNPEVLLAYKQQRQQDDNGLYKNYPLVAENTNHSLTQYRGTSFRQLSKYRLANGSDQTWVGYGEWAPASEYRSKFLELEPRALASLYGLGINPLNNPGNPKYDVEFAWQLGAKYDLYCAKNIKFWYNSGEREWFEFPIYRMAEFYLNIAEGYNELGNPGEALYYLNIIRERGGIPSETETDQEILREIIEREWAVEFYAENQHYPHARHWRKGDSLIGGSMYGFTFTAAPDFTGGFPMKPEDYGDYSLTDAYVPLYAWHERMYLSPINPNEVNKGIILQNPGY